MKHIDQTTHNVDTTAEKDEDEGAKDKEPLHATTEDEETGIYT
jgi:hypothetical protein